MRSTHTPGRFRLPGVSLADLPGLLTGLVIGAPLLAALLTGLLAGGGEAWEHIVATGLAGYSAGTLATLALTSGLILLTACRRPGWSPCTVFPGAACLNGC